MFNGTMVIGGNLLLLAEHLISNCKYGKIFHETGKSPLYSECFFEAIKEDLKGK